MTKRGEHQIAILEFRPYLRGKGHIVQIPDDAPRGTTRIEIEQVNRHQARPMTQRIFHRNMMGRVIIRKDEVLGYQGVDRGFPGDIAVFRTLVNEERDCCSGEGFGGAAGAEEGFWGGGFGGKGSDAVALRVLAEGL